VVTNDFITICDATTDWTSLHETSIYEYSLTEDYIWKDSWDRPTGRLVQTGGYFKLEGGNNFKMGIECEIPATDFRNKYFSMWVFTEGVRLVGKDPVSFLHHIKLTLLDNDGNNWEAPLLDTTSEVDVWRIPRELDDYYQYWKNYLVPVPPDAPVENITKIRVEFKLRDSTTPEWELYKEWYGKDLNPGGSLGNFLLLLGKFKLGRKLVVDSTATLEEIEEEQKDECLIKNGVLWCDIVINGGKLTCKDHRHGFPVWYYIQGGGELILEGLVENLPYEGPKLQYLEELTPADGTITIRNCNLQIVSQKGWKGATYQITNSNLSYSQCVWSPTSGSKFHRVFFGNKSPDLRGTVEECQGCGNPIFWVQDDWNVNLTRCCFWNEGSIKIGIRGSSWSGTIVVKDNWGEKFSGSYSLQYEEPNSHSGKVEIYHTTPVAVSGFRWKTEGGKKYVKEYIPISSVWCQIHDKDGAVVFDKEVCENENERFRWEEPVVKAEEQRFISGNATKTSYYPFTIYFYYIPAIDGTLLERTKYNPDRFFLEENWNWFHNYNPFILQKRYCCVEIDNNSIPVRHYETLTPPSKTSFSRTRLLPFSYKTASKVKGLGNENWYLLVDDSDRVWILDREKNIYCHFSVPYPVMSACALVTDYIYIFLTYSSQESTCWTNNQCIAWLGNFVVGDVREKLDRNPETGRLEPVFYLYYWELVDGIWLLFSQEVFVKNEQVILQDKKHVIIIPEDILERKVEFSSGMILVSQGG